MNKSFIKYAGLLIFLIISFQVQATHVVGGEIQLRWTGSGTIYEVRLNMYVNQISVENALQQTIELVEPKQKVYFTNSLADNFTLIEGLDLPLVYNKPIETNNNACAINAVIRTNLLIYSKTVDLADMLGAYSFNNYYITFEYCCRNNLITNLSNPANQTFSLYLKCPPLSNNNSSPSLHLLKNEYFCKDIFNTFDMGATDADGDRLEYSLVAPLQSIVPRRYTDDPTYNITRSVAWKNSTYSGVNPIPGSIPLTINPTTGKLTFNPSQTGIYCFGILIEEYRGNIKIGEVRKDYQFNVQNCTLNNKPVIAFTDATIKNSDTITVKINEKKCFPIYITDADAVTVAYQTINITSVLNAYPSSSITFPGEVRLNGLKNRYNTNLCLDPCATLRLDQTTYYPIQIIVNDNTCPVMYDTLIFTIKVEVEPNTKPTVFIDPRIDPQNIKVDSLIEFGVFGTDSDLDDVLSLTIFNKQSGMIFENVRDSVSTISSPFSWRPSCSDLQAGTYTLFFVVNDRTCNANDADTIQQTIVIHDNEISFEDMNITNLVTPNGDGQNDYYRVPGIPTGNCLTYFKGIEIYNRWGAKVFYSTDRLFSWYPEVSDGIYYYSIDFNSEDRKGWIEVIH